MSERLEPPHTAEAFVGGADASPDAAAWRALVERTLGAESAESFGHRTIDGLEIPPLSPRHRDDPRQPWRAADAWSIAPRIDHPSPDAANRLALTDLEGGSNALALVGAASPFARGFGFLPRHLDEVLAGVDLDFIRITIDGGGETPAFLEALANLVAARRLTSAGLDVDCGWDPIGLGARQGKTIADRLLDMLSCRRRAGLLGPLLRADGRPWHEAGGTQAQELAAVLATAVAYMRRLEDRNVPLDEAFGLVGFMLAADADVFLGIAKTRALRRLWAHVGAASQGTTVSARIHVETSWRMMTRRDPWTNVMRATAAAFAAGLGGADVITVLPFTLPLGLPDEDARRLARNLQHVLLEEAHLGAVEDPSAGSGAIETLTETLCRDAWRRFQDIECDGGIEAALPRLAEEVASSAAVRRADYAHGRRGIVGISRFPYLDLADPSVLVPAPHTAAKNVTAALPERRDAGAYEALRARADAMTQAGSRRPEVFLATLGRPAAHGPRVDEIVNLFAAAGIAAKAGPEAREIDALTEDFRASGARVACLHGMDAACANAASEVVAALRAAGATLVVAACETFAGDADAVLHPGVDLPDVLGQILDHV